ncbi:RAxF-45 family protein [Peribacillus sp. SCS-26]
MERYIGMRAQFLDYTYICRAIFHAVVFKGGSLPFFKNCIAR